MSHAFANARPHARRAHAGPSRGIAASPSTRALFALIVVASVMACDRYRPGSSGVDAAGPPGDGEGSSESGPGFEVTPETIAFAGTSSATMTVQSDGPWTAAASDDWLEVEPEEGSGDATIAVTVDREGLEVDTYEATISIEGGADTVTVPVTMRFPEIRGAVVSPDGRLFGASALAAEPAAASYVEGEILIRLDEEMVALWLHGRRDDAVGEVELTRAAEALASRVDAIQSTLLSPAMGLALIHLPPEQTSEALAELQADGRTRYAERNLLLFPTATDDPHYESQWHFDRIELETAWEQTTGDDGVTVAVIDGDFHPNHPDLGANLLPGWNFVDDNDDLFILNEACGSHGTHVAGTVAAVTGNGEGVAAVAPDVRVLPLNVAQRPEDDVEDECGLTSASVARAILYAAGVEDSAAGALDRPVDVINLSLGSEGRSSAIEDALEIAREAGVVSIAAAGNTGSSVLFPANSPATIAVSATDQISELTDYSARGPEIWVAAPGGDLTQRLDGHDGPPVSAPRAGVLSTGWAYESLPGGMVYDTVDDDPEHAYLLLQGTSMASPHVAGVVALMVSVNPDIQFDAARHLLAETALDLGSEGHNDEFGHGLVDAGEAVRAAADFSIVPYEQIVVGLSAGENVVVETTAGADGAFELGAVAAGDYLVTASHVSDGEEEASATVSGELPLSVAYDGDRDVEVVVEP